MDQVVYNKELPCLLLPSTLFEKILGKLGIYLPSFFVLLVYIEEKRRRRVAYNR